MKIIALALAAASLVFASPVSASSPPTRPSVQYYIIDGRTRLAGPFRSYYSCNARRVMIDEPQGDAAFCASNWIVR